MRCIAKLSGLEFSKIRYSKICKVSFVVIFFYCIVFSVFSISLDSLTQKKEPNNWKQYLEKESELLKEFEEGDDDYVNLYGADRISAQREINKYRIKHNLQPLESFWEIGNKIISSAFKVLLIFICIISINTIISEYNNGTIKQLFIRPYKRYKILLSKFIGVSIFGVLLLLFIVIISLAIGIVVSRKFYFNDIFVGIFFNEIFVTRYYFYIFLEFVLYIPVILLAIAFCFIVILVSQSKSISLIFTLLSLLLDGTFSSILINKISITKYLFINNLNLIEYFYLGRNNGLTFTQSIVSVLVNTILFIIISIYIFNKREIYT